MATDYSSTIYQQFLTEWFNETRKNTAVFPSAQTVVINGRAEPVSWIKAHTVEIDGLGIANSPLETRATLDKLHSWCTSEQGQWVRERALTVPEWQHVPIHSTWPLDTYNIFVMLAGAPLTEWLLKYGTDTVSAG